MSVDCPVDDVNVIFEVVRRKRVLALKREWSRRPREDQEWKDLSEKMDRLEDESMELLFALDACNGHYRSIERVVAASLRGDVSAPWKNPCIRMTPLYQEPVLDLFATTIANPGRHYDERAKFGTLGMYGNGHCDVASQHELTMSNEAGVSYCVMKASWMLIFLESCPFRCTIGHVQTNRRPSSRSHSINCRRS